jgi:hypothetical protein
LCFLLETSEPICVGGIGYWKYFDRYLSIDVWIESAIDLAHSTGANLRADFVMPNLIPGATVIASG